MASPGSYLFGEHSSTHYSSCCWKIMSWAVRKVVVNRGEEAGKSQITQALGALLSSLVYYCVNKLPKFNGFKQYLFMISEFFRSEVWMQPGSAGSSVQDLVSLTSRCLLDWALIWKLLGRFCFHVHSDLWQNPVICLCKMGYHLSLPHDSLHLQEQY